MFKVLITTVCSAGVHTVVVDFLNMADARNAVLKVNNQGMKNQKAIGLNFNT